MSSIPSAHASLRFTSRRFSLLALCMTAISPLSAQENEQSVLSPTEQIHEIVVTGSRIKRRDFASPSPISSINQETLLYSGQPTIEEALNQMPQIQPDFGRTSNNPGDGTARLNLRGLGAERTLVMFNGRRLAPSGAGSSIDVNNLPQALIKNVEIITGGASTVYGSDAIAGVVNFITRDDLDGMNIEASTYITGEGDSQVNDLNISYGTSVADGRGSVTAFAGVLDRDETFAVDRDFTAFAFQENFEGALITGGSSAIPAGVVLVPGIDLGNGPTAVRFDANGDPVPFVRPDDLYNFAPVNYLQTPLTRYSAGAFLDFEFHDSIEAYAEFSWTRNEAKRNLASVPLGGFFVINTDNPLLSDATRQITIDQFFPAGPGQAAFGLRKRLTDVGERITNTERDYSRLVAGLRGAINDTWDFDTWVSYTDNDETALLLNDVSLSRVEQGLLVDPASGQCFDTSRGCVPVNLFGEGSLSSEAIDFIRLAPLQNTTSRRQKLISGFVTGAPVDTWAGPVNIAIGAEWRSDEANFQADPDLFSGDGVGFSAASPIQGREEVIEIYAEAIVPLLQGIRLADYLGMEVGVRYSDYNNAGTVDSTKLGAQWQPLAGVRFRVMAQHSVRAPNLAEAFEAQFAQEGSFVGNNPIEDPCSASADPVGNGNVERCISQGIPADQIGVFEAIPGFPTSFIQGGNPNLRPEEAKTLTAGVVLTLDAMPGWRLAIDYFSLEVTETIGELAAEIICFDPANVSDLFCGNLRRDAATFNVSEVLSPTSNVGASEVAGIDSQISFTRELPTRYALGSRSATLNIDTVWTHFLERSFQLDPVTSPFNCRGQFGRPCTFSGGGGQTFPMNRITTNARYSSGDFGLNLTWRWIGGSDNARPQELALFGLADTPLQVNQIGSKSYFDLGASYQATDALGFRLNISNLTDTQPPQMANSVLSNNTDTTTYDIFGRAYQLSMSLSF